MLLIAKWSSNEKTLEPEDIIDVLYSYSREFDHNDKFKDFIYEEMKSNKNDTLAYLTALVRYDVILKYFFYKTKKNPTIFKM